MIGIGVKRTSSTFSLNSISALLQSNERFITQDDPNPITPSFTLSRPDDGVSNPSMWVAPCAVVFAADATTDTAVTLPYHECFYYWDYGDSAQETEYWQYGARPGTQSKNHDRGPIGGHLYAEPGTYTVTLHVLDAFGNYNTASQTITVTDPDVIFAGAKTYCISADGDFTGAPADVPPENLITSLGGTDLWSLAGSDRRFLFKRGHTYTTSNAAGFFQFINQRNVQIGSFGSEALAKPVLSATITNGKIFTFWGKNGIADNLQVFGLKLANPNDDNSISPADVSIYTSKATIMDKYGHLTFYDLETENLRGIGVTGNGAAVVNCNFDVSGAGGAVGLWSSNAHDSMIMGNFIDNSGRAEHVCRVQGGRRMAIAHNDFRNPASNGKHCLSIRGSTVSKTGDTYASTWAADTQVVIDYYVYLRTPTTPNGFLYGVADVQGDRRTHATDEPVWPTTIGETVVDNNVTWRCEYVDTTAATYNNVPAYYVSNLYNVCDNLFATTIQNGGASNYLTHIAHMGDSNYYELSEDIIWDGNFYLPNINNASGTFVLLFIQSSQKISIRNNLFNMTRPDSTSGETVGVYSHGPYISGMPKFDYAFVYNNSFFSNYAAPDSNKDHFAIRFPATTSPNALVAKNNLAYFPNAIDSFVIDDLSTAAIASNNTSNSQSKTDNPFSVSVPYDVDDYKLSETSYAKEAGVNVDAMFIDYFSTTRDRASFDIGAISKDS